MTPKGQTSPPAYRESARVDTHPLVSRLTAWGRTHRRTYPWRCDPKPYAVLTAVFMLQRTGVSQVMNVYEDFLARFPDAESLAAADVEQVRVALRRLGRLGRAEVLKRMAEALVEQHRGTVPDRLEQLEGASPGWDNTPPAPCCVSRFTDRISCLTQTRTACFPAPSAWNRRSLRPHTDQALIAWLDQLVPENDAEGFNLALLDLGSTVCRKSLTAPRRVSSRRRLSLRLPIDDRWCG